MRLKGIDLLRPQHARAVREAADKSGVILLKARQETKKDMANLYDAVGVTVSGSQRPSGIRNSY